MPEFADARFLLDWNRSYTCLWNMKLGAKRGFAYRSLEIENRAGGLGENKSAERRP